MFDLIEKFHGAFKGEWFWTFPLRCAVGLGLIGLFFGYAVSRSVRNAEENRLAEIQPEYANRYLVMRGQPNPFRMDTLDQDLRKVGLDFNSMGGLEAAPRADMENIQLKNGLYLYVEWRPGKKMPADVRARTERIVWAHEARLKVQ